MTKQDKKIRVSFGGGFKNRSASQKMLYPKERLSEFLNIDPSNELDVRNYCSKFTLIPRDLTKGLLIGFCIEQEAIKQVLENYKSGALNNKGIDKINSELSVYPKVRLTSNQSLSDINKSMGSDNTSLSNNPKTVHLLKTEHHLSTVSSLWSDLVEYFMTQQKIRECVDCGKFFVLENPKKIFCDDSCRDRYKKRKNYRAKIKKIK